MLELCTCRGSLHGEARKIDQFLIDFNTLRIDNIFAILQFCTNVVENQRLKRSLNQMQPGTRLQRAAWPSHKAMPREKQPNANNLNIVE